MLTSTRTGLSDTVLATTAIAALRSPPPPRSPSDRYERASQYSDGDRRRSSAESRGNSSVFQSNRDSFRVEPPRGPKALLIEPPSGPRSGAFGGGFERGRARGGRGGRPWPPHRDDSRDRGGRDREDSFRERRDFPPRDERSKGERSRAGLGSRPRARAGTTRTRTAILFDDVLALVGAGRRREIFANATRRLVLMLSGRGADLETVVRPRWLLKFRSANLPCPRFQETASGREEEAGGTGMSAGPAVAAAARVLTRTSVSGTVPVATLKSHDGDGKETSATEAIVYMDPDVRRDPRDDRDKPGPGAHSAQGLVISRSVSGSTSRRRLLRRRRRNSAPSRFQAERLQRLMLLRLTKRPPSLSRRRRGPKGSVLRPLDIPAAARPKHRRP